MAKDCLVLNGIWEAEFCLDNHEPAKLLPNQERRFDAKLKVPGYWQEQGFSFHGTVIYRKKFLWRPEHFHYLLEIGAIDYLAEIWLNDVYLGTTESEYVSFQADVTRFLREGENTLLVFVTSVLPVFPERKEQIKGANLHWDCIPCKLGPVNDPLVPSSSSGKYPTPVLATGGIVGDVNLIAYHTFYCIKRSVITQLEEDLKNGFLCLKLSIHHWGPYESYPVEIALTPDNFQGNSFSFQGKVDLIPGLNRVQLSFKVVEPVLWWARGMGRPNLYQMSVNFYNPAGGLEDAWSEKVGFRRVDKDGDWGLYLNNQRFFARGFNYMASVFHRTVTEKQLAEDLNYVLGAHANMIRVFGHVTQDKLYQLCDENGILIFQDLPFQWGYNNTPDFIRKACRVVEEIILNYAGHPSIFLWCAHSESRYLDYNKLDQVMVETIRDYDFSRPIVKNSVLAVEGEAPSSLLDFHEFKKFTEDELKNLSVSWMGWYWGKIENIVGINPYFITEFGAQSLPDPAYFTPEIASVESLPNIGFQKDVFFEATGKPVADLKELSHFSQEYQARFYEYHIEELRLKKYRNCNGLLAFHLAGAYPAADWSVLDYWRHPQKAYELIKEKFQPVLPVVVIHQPGKEWVEFALQIINDFHQEFADVSITMTMIDANGRDMEMKELEDCRIRADEVTEAGTVRFSMETVSRTAAIRLMIYNQEMGMVTNTEYYRIVESIRSLGKGVIRRANC